jgi:hypothetical protein
MGKNQSASNLTNIIQQDANGGIAFMSGSTMLMALSNTGQMSGSVPVLAAATASFVQNAQSASYVLTAQTASFVQNAQSASYVLTAQTASFVANAQSASNAVSAQTASFVALAQSASNAVSAQTASFANTFTVNSTLTAQTLVVQTITSSVDFVTGSTRFGSLLDNTHLFTGSVSMTGSLAVVTTGTEFQVGATGVTLGNAITDTHNITGSVNVTGSLNGSSATFTQSGTTTVSVNATSNTAYSAFIHAENGVNKTYLEYINSAYADSSRRNYFEAFNTVGGVSIWTNSIKALDINTSQAATFSGALNGTSGNFSSFVYVGNGNPLRIYNTGNGDYGNLTFATATGFTFDKGITSTAASGFIGAYSTNPANDTRIGAYWADSSALEMRYNANSAVGYIQSLYENVGGQAFGDIHFRQNVGGGTMATRMMIKNNNGSIGIGTITPTNLLSVRGNADFGATGIAYAGMSQYGALTFPRGQIMWSNTNSQNQLYIVGNAFSNNNGVFAYRNSGQPATAIGLDNGGIAFLTAGNGTADAAISWTSAMGISNAGYVTKPSNPAFRAYYSVNSTWVLAEGATFAFDVTEYNIGSCYNTSNGRFTAPVAGVYQFNFYTIILGNYQNGALSFRKNGGAPTSGYNVHFSPYQTATVWSNVVYTTALYLNAGDYVYMINASGTVNYHGDDWSSFSGYLVG